MSIFLSLETVFMGGRISGVLVVAPDFGYIYSISDVYLIHSMAFYFTRIFLFDDCISLIERQT